MPIVRGQLDRTIKLDAGPIQTKARIAVYRVSARIQLSIAYDAFQRIHILDSEFWGVRGRGAEGEMLSRRNHSHQSVIIVDRVSSHLSEQANAAVHENGNKMVDVPRLLSDTRHTDTSDLCTNCHGR